MADVEDVDYRVVSNIDSANTISTSTLAQSQAFLNALESSATNISVPFIGNNAGLRSLNINASPIQFSPSNINHYTDTSDLDRANNEFDNIKEPILDNIDASAINANAIDDFNGESPVLSPISEPTQFNESVPETPSINPIDVPSAPSYTLPDAPTFNAIEIPASPAVTMPSFSSTLPYNDLTAPDNTYSYTEKEYVSALLDSVKSKLNNDVVNGGTGLAPDIEQAIWDREVERDDKALQTAINNTIDTWSARGFDLPNGTLAAEIDKLTRDYEHSRLTRSRDIAIKQAELAQNNTQFAITSSINMESILLQHANNVANRALQSAKYILDAAISIFNAKVTNYNMKLDAYKTEAQVFESRIRAELSKVEVFKAQLDGARLQGDLQINQVNLYKSQIEGISTLINIYKTKVEAARVATSVELAKLDEYKAQVEGFATKLKAKSLEYDLYKAKLSGQEAKVSLFSSQVSAYKTKIEGETAKIDAQLNIAKVKNEKNREILSAYQTRLQALSSKYGVLAEKIRANASIAGVILEGDSKALSVAEAQARMDVSTNDIFARHVDSQAQLDVEKARSNLLAFTNIVNSQISAAKGGADVYAGMANAALSAVNTLVTLGSKALVTQSSSSTT